LGTAIGALALQAALWGHLAGLGPAGISALALAPMALAFFALRALPSSILPDVAVLVAVAGFGGLGMQIGGSLQVPPPGVEAKAVHHHHGEHSMSGAGTSTHPHHSPWHLVPMVIACTFGCWWLCHVRPATARPRDWRHHLAAFVFMMTGMFWAAWILPPILSQWISPPGVADHVAMVLGMVAGTAIGFFGVDLLDSRTPRGEGQASLPPGHRRPTARPSALCAKLGPEP
jgi:hypothetical protein